MRYSMLIALRCWWRPPQVRRFAPWSLVLALPLAVGCASESLKPEPVDARDLYWQLALNHYAVLLSMAPTYDTLRLRATPQNVQGAALPGFPAPTYQSRDVATVRVSSDGMLQAVAANSQPVWIVATLTAGNLRHVDSALVRVVDLVTPPVLASFSVHPLPPDSAKTSALGEPWLRRIVLPVRATDASGTPFDSLVPGGIPVYFHSSDTTIVEVDHVTGAIKGLIPGAVTLDASTTVFGVSKVDTVPYRIGRPIIVSVAVTATGILPGSEVTIGAGGMVLFSTSGHTDTVDVTFSEADAAKLGAAEAWPAASLFSYFGFFTLPTFCTVLSQFSQIDCTGVGNIVLVPPTVNSSAIAFRTFPVAGTYEYRSPRYGLAGRIVVVDER